MLAWTIFPLRRRSRGRNSLHIRVFCEKLRTPLSRTRSTSLRSLASLQYSLQTNCAAAFFNLCCSKWSVNNSCKFFRERRHFVHQLYSEKTATFQATYFVT